MGAEVGWHLRFVQARVVDVWANPSQASVFRELAATFGQWALSEETVGDALRLRFERKAPA